MTEVGRSMVEMLGVLAIMGIVGMVGVKMYTSAMNKHRANELIYEAQKRATMVAMQITAGQENLSVANFTNPTGYVFGVEKNPYNANQFNITIDAVPDDICTPMKAIVGPATPIRVISEYCDKLTFNNNLSTTAYASDIQTPTECADAGNTWCGGAGACSDIGCCDAHQNLPPCQVCSEGAIVTTPTEGTTCTYQEGGGNKTGICHLGTCEPAATGMTCDPGEDECTCTVMDGETPVIVDGEELQGHVCSMDRTNNKVNLCCRPTEICNNAGEVTNTSAGYLAKCITISGPENCAETNSCSECSTNEDCTKNNPNTETPWCKITKPSGVTTACIDPSNYKGTCTSIATTTNGGVTASSTTIYGLGEVIVSSSGINWWSAKNWCKAHGKKLINIEAFQAYYPTGTHAGELIRTASAPAGKSTPACRQSKTCTSWESGDVAKMWARASDGKMRLLTDALDEKGEMYRAKYSPVVLDLAQQFLGIKRYFWTASDYSSSNVCMAFGISTASGCVLHTDGRYAGYYAICQ